MLINMEHFKNGDLVIFCLLIVVLIFSKEGTPQVPNVGTPLGHFFYMCITPF